MAKMSDVKVELKFAPQLIITFDGKKLGNLVFKDLEVMAEFTNSLSNSIKALIKEFEGQKHGGTPVSDEH